jgi:predicted dienelactone hydrolase
MSRALVPLLAVASLVVGCPGMARAAAAPQVCNAVWTDQARGGRAVPVRVRMPAGTALAPLIVFSHGLGGSLDAGTDWVAAWAGAGFITINLQHAGSDTAIWKGQARPMQGLRGAMTADQLRARAEDVRFVLDQAARGMRAGDCDLGRADMEHIGMAGHSFGAQTTLAVSGARYGGAPAMRDPRIRAAIAFSPQPSKGQDDRAAFGGVTIPFFTVTGTRDALVWLNGVTAEDRVRPYAAMPAGGKYLLVIKDADHAMLGGQATRPRGTPPPAGMAQTVTEATTLFWRATLRGDARAAGELERFAARVGPGDRFSAK